MSLFATKPISKIIAEAEETGAHTLKKDAERARSDDARHRRDHRNRYLCFDRAGGR